MRVGMREEELAPPCFNTLFFVLLCVFITDERVGIYFFGRDGFCSFFFVQCACLCACLCACSCSCVCVCVCVEGEHYPCTRNLRRG